jgi:hypothetical protein
VLSKETILSLEEEARAEMLHLGIDPQQPNAYMLLAFVLLNDRRIFGGQMMPENPDVIQISADAHRRLHQVAGPAANMIAALKFIQANYASIDCPTAQDVLEHTWAALRVMNEALEPFRIARWSGLPTPLFLVFADLLNVRERRSGRLFAPTPRNEKAHDSSADCVREMILAYAADAIRRFIAQGRGKGAAAKEVANVLQEAGFRKPGGRKGYAAGTLEKYFDAARKGGAKFQQAYDTASQSPLEASPNEICDALREVIREFTVHRTITRKKLR